MSNVSPTEFLAEYEKHTNAIEAAHSIAGWVMRGKTRYFRKDEGAFWAEDGESGKVWVRDSVIDLAEVIERQGG